MISTDSVRNLIGTTAYGPDGSKLGTVGQVYLDSVTGQPAWATVKTGLFGARESFVPLTDAEQTDDGVRVAYDKDRIKSAPGIDADGELSPDEESSLYEHYGMAGTTDETSTGMTGDDAMTRSEEQVRTGTRSETTGKATLRKYVVTDTQQVSVPVSHEEVRLEREPITDANRDAALSGPDLSEAEHEVVLNAERPVVEKETVPVERVRLSKERVDDQETMDVDVASERIDTAVDGDVGSVRGRDRDAGDR